MRNPNLCLVRITEIYIERGKGSIGKVKGSKFPWTEEGTCLQSKGTYQDLSRKSKTKSHLNTLQWYSRSSKNNEKGLKNYQIIYKRMAIILEKASQQQ